MPKGNPGSNVILSAAKDLAPPTNQEPDPSEYLRMTTIVSSPELRTPNSELSPMQSHRELIVEPVVLDVEKLPKPVRWAELFGNDRPVELEIGIGKGTFL